MRNLLLLLFVAFIFTACSKDDESRAKNAQSEEKIPSVLRSSGFDYEHNVVMQRFMLSNGSKSLKVVGQFLDNSGNLNSSQSALNVAAKPLSSNSQNAFIEYTNLNEPGFTSDYGEFKGQNVEVILTALGVADTATIYSPKDLIVNTDQDLRNFDRTKDLNVTWNTDSSNPFTDISVALISRGVDGDIEPKTKDLHHTAVTADDGSYTISASEFSKWPLDLHIDLVLIRANQVFMPDSKTLLTCFVHNLHTGEITH